MAGNKRRPSHPTNGRLDGPPRTTYAPSLRSTRLPTLAAGQVSPAIHTGDEARAAHTVLVSNILAALLIRDPGNPDAQTFLMP